MKAGEVEYERCFESKRIELLMVDVEEINHTDIEICKFRLQQGAKLRYQYRDLEDMNTEFDTICLVRSQWAAFGGNSLSYFTSVGLFEKGFDMESFIEKRLLEIDNLDGRKSARLLMEEVFRQIYTQEEYNKLQKVN